MRAARSVLAKFVIAATCIACSGDSLTDPFAPPGLALTLTPAVKTLVIGGTTQIGSSFAFTLSATSMGRLVTTPRGVEWTSSDPSVAVVDSTGVVTAVSLGTTTVTARVNDERARSTVFVTLAVRSP
jgi:uncharacterized protein YjdB